MIEKIEKSVFNFDPYQIDLINKVNEIIDFVNKSTPVEEVKENYCDSRTDEERERDSKIEITMTSTSIIPDEFVKVPLDTMEERLRELTYRNWKNDDEST